MPTLAETVDEVLRGKLPRKRHDSWVQEVALSTWEVVGLNSVSASELSNELNRSANLVIKPRTRRWRQTYRKTGRFPHVESASRPSRLGRPRMLCASDEALLQSIIDHNPRMYIKELRLKLLDLSGRLYSHDVVERTVLHRLKNTNKVLQRRAAQRRVFLRETYIETMRLIPPEMVMFIDETHRDQGAGQRKRGWSKRGTPAVVTESLERVPRYTVVAASDIHGFVLNACTVRFMKTGPNDNNPTRGTMCKSTFTDYFERMVVPLLGNYFCSEPRSVVSLDSASIHDLPKLQELARQRGAVVVASAPYSPDLIPIEYFFKLFKGTLKKLEGSGMDEIGQMLVCTRLSLWCAQDHHQPYP